MEEETEVEENKINFIPCVCFVKRGVAKENPDKITLTREELAKVIQDTKRELDEADEDDDENEAMDTDTDATGRQNTVTTDEFNFANYDAEEGAQVAAISDIAVFDDDDQLGANDDENDSEAEDDLINATDNLILVGRVADDAAMMEVFIYNEQENSLYVHHDFILPSFPLCIEWLNYDPEAKDPGNFCAIGCMEPIITLWDLDIQDALEPTLKLGSKGSRKKKIPKYGHTDAVLDMSWNTHFPHILASGSVDQTVILWDLDEAKPHTTIRSFQEKVQSIKFHPTEAQLLLTGNCDGTVKLFDCRDPDEINDNYKIWTINGEIERVAWDLGNSNRCFASTNHGDVICIDIRQPDKIVWTQKCHGQEVTGLSVNEKQMLSTASSDGTVKFWKFKDNGLELVYENETGMGKLQCMVPCPESSFILAVGGDNKKKNFRLIDSTTFDSVRRTFL